MSSARRPSAPCTAAHSVPATHWWSLTPLATPPIHCPSSALRVGTRTIVAMFFRRPCWQPPLHPQEKVQRERVKSKGKNLIKYPQIAVGTDEFTAPSLAITKCPSTRECSKWAVVRPCCGILQSSEKGHAAETRNDTVSGKCSALRKEARRERLHSA